jgi:hypothetical protein
MALQLGALRESLIDAGATPEKANNAVGTIWMRDPLFGH